VVEDFVEDTAKGKAKDAKAIRPVKPAKPTKSEKKK
jgi:hypothetical protein